MGAARTPKRPSRAAVRRRFVIAAGIDHHRTDRGAVAAFVDACPGALSMLLRPRIARLPPLLARALFMSRTVHPRTTLKTGPGPAPRRQKKAASDRCDLVHFDVPFRERWGNRRGGGKTGSAVARTRHHRTRRPPRVARPVSHQPVRVIRPPRRAIAGTGYAASRRAAAPLKPGQDPLAPDRPATTSRRQWDRKIRKHTLASYACLFPLRINGLGGFNCVLQRVTLCPTLSQHWYRLIFMSDIVRHSHRW